MNPTPQAVTERYVSNLINYGRNREFDITYIERLENVVNEDSAGFYFNVCILKTGDLDNGANRRQAVGATISQAVRRALEKHGVTFR